MCTFYSAAPAKSLTIMALKPYSTLVRAYILVGPAKGVIPSQGLSAVRLFSSYSPFMPLTYLRTRYI